LKTSESACRPCVENSEPVKLLRLLFRTFTQNFKKVLPLLFKRSFPLFQNATSTKQPKEEISANQPEEGAAANRTLSEKKAKPLYQR
jgi:hypothetical protein